MDPTNSNGWIWPRRQRRKATFSVLVFLLFGMEVWCLLPLLPASDRIIFPSTSREQQQGLQEVTSFPLFMSLSPQQKTEPSPGNIVPKADTDHLVSEFPIKATRIKIKDTTSHKHIYNSDNLEEKTNGIGENEESTSSIQDGSPIMAGDTEDADNDAVLAGQLDQRNYFSLEKVTRDLLDVNRTATGSWTPQDCAKVANVVSMWSRRTGGPGRPQPAIQQERLLRRVIEEKEALNTFALDLKLNGMYHDIIHSWSKSTESGGIHRAEEILYAMQEAYNRRQDSDLQPAIDAWNSILNAYAHSKSKDGPDHTIRVINKLYRLIAEGKTEARPNDESYASILKAVAGTGERNAPKHVLDLLSRMEGLARDGFAIDVTSSCHNVYVASLVDSMRDPKVSPSDTARMADSHLRKMKENTDPNSQPDRKTYNIVISGWSKSGDRNLTTKAESLLEEMEASIENNADSSRTAPNKYTYNCIIFCYTWSHLENKGEKALAILEKMKRLGQTNPFCRPDYTTYNAVMNCITKGNQPSAPFQVEALLEEMTEIYERTGDSSMRPMNRSFNACVNAWARSNSNEAPERIINWINRMQDDFESGRTNVMPNKWTYNSYLQALAKRRKPSSADEAERILSMMEEKSQRFHSNTLKPDVLTYTNVLHCIALSESNDAFQRAYAILIKMESGDGDVRPNVYTYNVLINVVAKSKIPGKAKIAVQLVNRMKEVAIRPIIITYNNALNACAYSDKARDDPKEVLHVATMILKEAQVTCGANYISYSTYLRVVRYYVHDRLEQWRLIRKTFRRCCQDGQLTPTIMKQIRPVLSAHQYSLLVREATDKKTGRWHTDYTRNAVRLKTQPLRRHQSIQYK